jgi:hypothetical protein
MFQNLHQFISITFCFQIYFVIRKKMRSHYSQILHKNKNSHILYIISFSIDYIFMKYISYLKIYNEFCKLVTIKVIQELNPDFIHSIQLCQNFFLFNLFLKDYVHYCIYFEKKINLFIYELNPYKQYH